MRRSKRSSSGDHRRTLFWENRCRVLLGPGVDACSAQPFDSKSTPLILPSPPLGLGGAWIHGGAVRFTPWFGIFDMRVPVVNLPAPHIERSRARLNRMTRRRRSLDAFTERGSACAAPGTCERMDKFLCPVVDDGTELLRMDRAYLDRARYDFTVTGRCLRPLIQLERKRCGSPARSIDSVVASSSSSSTVISSRARCAPRQW